MKRLLFAGIALVASCTKSHEVITFTVSPKNDTDNMSNTRFVDPTPLVYHSEAKEVQLLKFPGATVQDIRKSMTAAGYAPAPINYHYPLMKEEHPQFTRVLPLLCISPENSSDDRCAFITLTPSPKYQVEMLNADSLIAKNGSLFFLVYKK